MYLFSDVHYSLSALISDPVVAILNMMLRCSLNGGKQSFERVGSLGNDHGFPLDL